MSIELNTELDMELSTKLDMKQDMKLGIIGAMDVEVDLIKARLSQQTTQKFAGMEFVQGEYAHVPLVVVCCKVGKVNAALCTQILVSSFGVTHVINTGVAGSLDAAINIGDMVVSVDVVHHDMDVCNLGYAPGQVPGFSQVAFEANESLRRVVKQAAAMVVPDSAVHDGRVATGDAFVRTDSEKQRIKQVFCARCCEMEGAGVAQACYVNAIPFVIVRAISDKADGSDAQQYDVFEKHAAEHSAAVVLRSLELLGAKGSAGQ